MASESAPPNPNDDNNNSSQQNPGPVRAISGNEPILPGGGEGEISQKSVFVNSEPVREEQVQNAVKFLSHPKVRGSPVIHRRSFLEKKGLTKEEIDEAFRRVPDPAPSATTAVAPASPNQVGQASVATNTQQQVPAQAPPAAAAAAAPTGVVSTITRKASYHWSSFFIAIGLLAASGAGTVLLIKNSFIPRLKSWIRKVVLEEGDNEDLLKKNNSRPSFAEEVAAAAIAAASAAADAAKASQEMLYLKNEDRRYFDAFMSAINVQVEEMKLMSSAIQKLGATSEASMPSIKQTEDHKSALQNGRLLSAPPSTEPSVAPHPKSYMEIMAMVQRGEKPPGIREINDMPPNPNQLPSKPLIAPRSKPWEIAQSQNNSYQGQGSSSSIQDGTPIPQLNGDSEEPLWRQRNVTVTESGLDNGWMPTPDRAKNIQRAWVPPQPPPIAMPEAAAAIRHPKPSSIPKEESGDGQEMVGVAMKSESGGIMEMNAVNGGSDEREIELEE